MTGELDCVVSVLDWLELSPDDVVAGVSLLDPELADDSVDSLLAAVDPCAALYRLQRAASGAAASRTRRTVARAGGRRQWSTDRA